MTTNEPLSAVTIISGDREVAAIVKGAALVFPALAGHYDGFMNDVSSEYANPSLVRPRSVRQAQLTSEVTVRFYCEDVDAQMLIQPRDEEALFDFTATRCLPGAGHYYVGWTMYDDADFEENLTAWVGVHKVAYVRTPDNDNRVHLYVLNEPFYFDEGERLLLVTDANDAPYRLENVVLLHELPHATARPLQIRDIAAELDHDAAGTPLLRLNWRTSRPTRGQVRVGQGDHTTAEITEANLLANHCVTFTGITPTPESWFVISGISQAAEQVTTGQSPLAPVLPTGSGQAQAGAIPFTVANQQNAVAVAWPVTWGFPFPRGALWALDQCRLVDATGAVLPSQKRVQVAWDDGSIRWALVDFQVDLPATEQKHLTLEYGPSVVDKPPTRGLQATTTADGIVIDTGPLRLQFTRQAYSFPARVEVRQGDDFVMAVGGQGAFPALKLVDETGQVFTVTDGLEELHLEEAGPLRATVRIVAKHRAADGRGLFRSILRVSVYANQPYLRVQHTFENDNRDALFTSIRSLTLGANVAQGWQEQAWLGDNRLPLAGAPAQLLQSHADHFQIHHGHALQDEGSHAPNWLALQGAAGLVAVTMRDFWENYPKGWQASADGIQIELCPDIGAIGYPQAILEQVRAYYYLQEGQYKLKRGVARTHDLLFVFAPDGADFQDAIHLFSDPPLVRLDPHLLAQTGVLSALCPTAQPAAASYNTWTAEALALYEQDRVATQAYGLLNFGDWYGERKHNWGNLEYDTPYGFLLEYLRGGSGRYFTLGRQAAWHLADVDTCHYHTDPIKAGRQYLHTLGHVGDYFPDGILAGSIGREHLDWTHTWVEGLYLYALLTGERRLWEAATRTAEILAGADLNDYDFTNCRDCGWPLRHLIGAYQATGRKLFLNGASIIVERVLARQRPTGGWERLMVPGHCFHAPPRHMGNAGFMVGVLLAALKRYHEETQDQAVGAAIVAAARYLMRSMWEPELNAFRYTSCPASRTAAELNAQILEGVGYAWRLSGDTELRNALVAGLAACLTTPHNSTTPPDGKDISSRMRSLPFIMYDIASAGAN